MAGTAAKTTQDAVELLLTPGDILARSSQESVELIMDSGRTVYDSDYITDVLADTPKAYWELQEAIGLPLDSSGNGLDMTSVVGKPFYRQPGPLKLGDYAISMGGTEGFTRSTHVSTVTDNFTMEMVVCPVTILGNDSVMLYNGTAASNGWGIIIDTNAKFQYNCGGVAAGANSAAALSQTEFSLIHVVRDAGTWKYYINGSVDTSNAGTTTPNAPSGIVQIGHTTASVMRQIASHVAIFESVLSPTTISDRAALLFGVAGVSQYAVEMLMSTTDPNAYVSDQLVEMVFSPDLQIATLSSGTIGFGGVA